MPLGRGYPDKHVIKKELATAPKNLNEFIELPTFKKQRHEIYSKLRKAAKK